jgi:hypothetical protein
MHPAHQLQHDSIRVLCTAVAVTNTPPLLYSATHSHHDADQTHCIPVAHKKPSRLLLTVIDDYIQLLTVMEAVKVTMMCLNCQRQHLLAAVRQTR